MSTTKRVISGSAASWVRIGITMVSQMIFVPIYLSYWNVKTYGIWIAVQALVGILSTLDQGHQTFLEFEFLKFGKDNREKISHHLSSGVLIASIIGVVEIFIVLAFIFSNSIKGLLGDISSVDVTVIRQAGMTLLIQTFVWVFTGCLGGIFVRVLSPFGYYARMSWWGVWAAVITSVVPVVAIMFGADLLHAGIALAAGTVVYNIPLYIDMFRLMKRENIHFKSYSFKTGFVNLAGSMAISGKGLLENARQQGVRVILAPLSGASGLVAFSTMRTGANIALQGLNTITNPLMPELMHFLNKKDQQRTEASFGTVWFVLLVFLAPGVVLLQAFVEPLFHLWTKGQVQFNPLLFSLLSLGVLVYAVAQPAMAIVKGNNLLKAQLIISVIAAIVVVGGMFVLIPVIGIVGAGIALLASELAAAIGYRISAKSWLDKNGLVWPQKSSRIALMSVWIAAFTMVGMTYLVQFKWMIFSIGLVLLIGAIRLYWLSLPALVADKAKSLIAKVKSRKTS